MLCLCLVWEMATNTIQEAQRKLWKYWYTYKIMCNWKAAIEDYHVRYWHGWIRVQFPQEESGRDWKLSQPWHGLHQWYYSGGSVYTYHRRVQFKSMLTLVHAVIHQRDFNYWYTTIMNSDDKALDITLIVFGDGTSTGPTQRSRWRLEHADGDIDVEDFIVIMTSQMAEIMTLCLSRSGVMDLWTLRSRSNGTCVPRWSREGMGVVRDSPQLLLPL